MKFIISLILVAMLFAVTGVAYADSTTYTTTLLSATTGSSSVYRVGGYPVKQLIVGRYNAASTAFDTYSGVFAAYGCVSLTGACAPLKDVQGVAISKTHDGTGTGVIYNIDDMTQYIKVVFTATRTAAHNAVTAILNYGGRIVSPQ